MLGEFTNFPEHPKEVVVFRWATPNQLRALTPKVINATCQLEHESSDLGVEAQFGKHSYVGGQPLKESPGNQEERLGSYNGFRRACLKFG